MSLMQKFNGLTTRDARIAFVTGVVLRNLLDLEKCSAKELKRRQAVVRKALEVSPEVAGLMQTFVIVFQPEGKTKKMRRRMENARVQAAAKEAKRAREEPMEPIRVGQTAGGAEVIRLPAFNGRETAALKEARRALIARAAEQQQRPPEAS